MKWEGDYHTDELDRLRAPEAVSRIIVERNEHPIVGPVNIGLEVAETKLEGVPKRSNRILGSSDVSASVGKRDSGVVVKVFVSHLANGSRCDHLSSDRGIQLQRPTEIGCRHDKRSSNRTQWPNWLVGL